MSEEEAETVAADTRAKVLKIIFDEANVLFGTTVISLRDVLSVRCVAVTEEEHEGLTKKCP